MVLDHIPGFQTKLIPWICIGPRMLSAISNNDDTVEPPLFRPPMGHGRVSRLQGCPNFGVNLYHTAYIGTVLNTGVSTFQRFGLEGFPCITHWFYKFSFIAHIILYCKALDAIV